MTQRRFHSAATCQTSRAFIRACFPPSPTRHCRSSFPFAALRAQAMWIEAHGLSLVQGAPGVSESPKSATSAVEYVTREVNSVSDDRRGRRAYSSRGHESHVERIRQPREGAMASGKPACSAAAAARASMRSRRAAATDRIAHHHADGPGQQRGDAGVPGGRDARAPLRLQANRQRSPDDVSREAVPTPGARRQREVGAAAARGDVPEDAVPLRAPRRPRLLRGRIEDDEPRGGEDRNPEALAAGDAVTADPVVVAAGDRDADPDEPRERRLDRHARTAAVRDRVAEDRRPRLRRATPVALVPE